MYTANSQNNMNPYLVKEIMEANPKKLLLKVYDFAILNCQKRNMIKANEALGVLISALRFDDATYPSRVINAPLRISRFNSTSARLLLIRLMSSGGRRMV